ncbi:MAG: DNA-3-methyladenine glycosylase [Pseudomonadaceae bacterium]
MPDTCTPAPTPLPEHFFQRDARELAVALLGKVIRRQVDGQWLAARIIETEAYLLEERGSHASLGFTQARRALFMDPGTIYMYYARGGDSMNCSAQGEGCGVLLKSGHPVVDTISPPSSLVRMQQLNPQRNGQPRTPERLCAGQTLLCRSLDIRVPDWNAQQFDASALLIEDDGYRPAQIVRAARLGIPSGRDEHLFYRWVDADYCAYCTRNPLGRSRQAGQDYQLLERATALRSAIRGDDPCSQG